MDVEAVTTFFALLAVLCLVFVAAVLVVAVVSRVRGGLPEGLVPVREGIGQAALPLAFAVATTATLGSLYLSEVANYPPCILCWYQRIAMYPLPVILGIAALRRDHSVKWYVVPVAAIGAAIGTYHYLLERFPDQVASACTTDVPCETVWVWKFHFLSIPAMAWVGFVTIITLALLSGPGRGRPADPRSLGGGSEADGVVAADEDEPAGRAQEVRA